MENNTIFKNCQIIGLSIIIGELLFGLVLWYVFPQGEYKPDAFSFYAEVVMYPLAMAVAYITAKFMTFNKIKRIIKGKETEQAQAQQYYNYYIMRLAMIEGVYFLAVIFYTIFSIEPCLYVAIVMFLCNALAYKAASAAKGELENILNDEKYQK